MAESKFLSRKFIVTIAVMILSVAAPILYQNLGVSETVTLTVLAMIGGVGTAYGVINYKDAKLDQGKEG